MNQELVSKVMRESELIGCNATVSNQTECTISPLNPKNHKLSLTLNVENEKDLYYTLEQLHNICDMLDYILEHSAT